MPKFLTQVLAKKEKKQANKNDRMWNAVKAV